MAELTAHTPGAFCWPELGTTDPAAAAGGTVLMTKDLERVGRFALVRDPQGAGFCVIALAPSM